MESTIIEKTKHKISPGYKAALLTVRIMILVCLLDLVGLYLYESEAHPTDVTVGAMFLHFIIVGLPLLILLPISVLARRESLVIGFLAAAGFFLIPAIGAILSNASHFLKHFI